MTRPELDAIAQRAAAASPGPWQPGVWVGRCAKSHPHPGRCKFDYQFVVAGNEDCLAAADRQLLGPADSRLTLGQADLEFVMHARADIPALVEYCRALEAERARLGAVAEAARAVVARPHGEARREALAQALADWEFADWEPPDGR